MTTLKPKRPYGDSYLLAYSEEHVFYEIDMLFGPTDVIAEDFCPSGVWKKMQPVLSVRLKEAQIRANKELAHLTTDRQAASSLAKTWDTAALLAEIMLLHVHGLSGQWQCRGRFVEPRSTK